MRPNCILPVHHRLHLGSSGGEVSLASRLRLRACVSYVDVEVSLAASNPNFPAFAVRAPRAQIQNAVIRAVGRQWTATYFFGGESPFVVVVVFVVAKVESTRIRQRRSA